MLLLLLLLLVVFGGGAAAVAAPGWFLGNALPVFPFPFVSGVVCSSEHRPELLLLCIGRPVGVRESVVLNLDEVPLWWYGV